MILANLYSSDIADVYYDSASTPECNIAQHTGWFWRMLTDGESVDIGPFLTPLEAIIDRDEHILRGIGAVTADTKPKVEAPAIKPAPETGAECGCSAFLSIHSGCTHRIVTLTSYTMESEASGKDGETRISGTFTAVGNPVTVTP